MVQNLDENHRAIRQGHKSVDDLEKPANAIAPLRQRAVAGILQPQILFALYAGEPMDRLCWKHSRQNTGRPCVGRKGTVVSFPHCEQVVLVSDR
jgi:hypothetical protein